MKAITLHQPWATLIAIGEKTIETRSWATSYRGPLAIHAAVKNVPLGQKFGDWWTEGGYGVEPIEVRRLGATVDGELVADRRERGLAHPLPLGAVVATCELVAVVPTEEMYSPDEDRDFCDRWIVPGLGSWDVAADKPYGDFTPGRFAWLLADIRAIEPVPARGRQQLWEWSG